MSDAIERPLTPSIFARLASATRFAITGVTPESWFGPQQPLAPQAPPGVKGRQFDYAFGANLNYVPRAEGGLSFADLRALADALPLLRAVIETRKDQIAAQNFTVRQRSRGNVPDASARIDAALAFLARPDRRRSFADWLRMLIEDLLVIDAATIYPRYSRAGRLYSLDVIDGATIKPLIGEDGRAPDAPDPAYQQILHGVPAADFSADELLYLPRNLRAHRLYGMSPVEQIAMTVNIALRRDTATLDYYRAGSTPDAFATLPKDWTGDQISAFQDYFDAKMSGNLARRRMLKFMPAEFHLIDARQPPLKDQYDEWLARVICYAFSVPATPFVSQVNRATSETMRLQATQEGLVPLKSWIKNALDLVIQVSMDEPDLEFVWVGDDAIDPLQQAQTLEILVGAGIKTREEARAELGLGGEAKAQGLGKFNPSHDERGRFAAADSATGPTERTGNRSRRIDQQPAPPSLSSSTPTAEIIPICIASGIAIATDEFGNKLTTCHYDCYNGESFIRTMRGAVGCVPVRQPR
jgi:Phage portal protein